MNHKLFLPKRKGQVLLAVWFFLLIPLIQSCERTERAPSSASIPESPKSEVRDEAGFIEPDDKKEILSEPKNAYSLISWNIQKFGNKEPQEKIDKIASILRDYDIVAIQEVNRVSGAKDVARLADQLNRLGHTWDYKISDPTNSPGEKSERYAFLWKTKRTKMLGRPKLDADEAKGFYREPFLARFQIDGRPVLIVNYHSRKHIDHPEEEIINFYKYPSRFPEDRIIIAGDFNAPAADPVFEPLYKAGFRSISEGQKTTLKRKCTVEKEYLNHPIDFILYQKEKIGKQKSGIIDFVGSCENLLQSRSLSDHLPTYLEFYVK